jgi:peptide subunit release factor 1 (eRF1)
MDLAGVKKKLEDYEQMLQYYTLMRTKNKMKDFEAKLEEWWEVVEEYFIKELEKNLTQHRANEFFLKYELEAYQNNFLDFICGSPISIKVSIQDEDNSKGGKLV